MRLSDTGKKAAEYILTEIKAKHIIIPDEISLKYLEEKTKCRVQSIGMSYNDYIKPILLANNIISTKCGSPVVLQLKYNDENNI